MHSFDQSDRILTYRLSAAYDCWGSRRSLRRGSHNGLWFVDAAELDEPAPAEPLTDSSSDRECILQRFAASGRFTDKELSTLRALTVERMTIAEIAARDRCSRQAVIARLIGNTRGQGGILRKARVLLEGEAISSSGA